MPDVEVLLLGTLEIRAGPTAFQISSRRQRALFARLLLARGHAVRAVELVASLYGDQTRSNAPHALHELVSSLRRSLEPMGLDAFLETGHGSYRFAIEPVQLDTVRFETLVAAAKEQDDRQVRAEILQEALHLWRGPALADVELADDAVVAEVERLEELRAGALADWLDLELDAGRHRDALGELDRATRLDPYNERLRSQLMLALYRDGRQADALRVYQETRQLLDEELGLEPTEELRELERKILNHDPTLRLNGSPRRNVGRRMLRSRRALAIALIVALGGGAAAAARALTAGGSVHAVLVDSMKGSGIDTKVWDVQALGNGPTAVADSDGTLLTIPAHATSTVQSGALGVAMATYCTLAGGFDVQVDYRLVTWPTANGVGVGIYAAWADAIRESSPVGEYYVGAHRIVNPPDGAPRAVARTTDTHGALRIVRVGNRMLIYNRGSGGWRQLFAFPHPTPAAVSVYLALYTTTRRFSHREVDVRLTNFRVNSGFLQCPD
jgi:DNA-binding SARP family transcriptional activator